MKEILAA